MCGEHTALFSLAVSVVGSSPHVRGAHRVHERTGVWPGIIPACAGSTSSTLRHASFHWDHPRMCGEHSYLNSLDDSELGSSPHVRGARHAQGMLVMPAGIIPACAGSTRTRNCWTRSNRDHPRMCGEHSRVLLALMLQPGSSPHVRGAQTISVPSTVETGIIPACAGSTHDTSWASPRTWDHPRMCGEHKGFFDIHSPSRGSSPHVRGARVYIDMNQDLPGIIPACAGSTISALDSPDSLGDHPRMCGEHSFHGVS